MVAPRRVFNFHITLLKCHAKMDQKTLIVLGFIFGLCFPVRFYKNLLVIGWSWQYLPKPNDYQLLIKTNQ